MTWENSLSKALGKLIKELRRSAQIIIRDFWSKKMLLSVPVRLLSRLYKTKMISYLVLILS